MNCNTELHNEMITMEYIQCPFYDQQLQKPSTINYLSCDKQNLVNENGSNICKRCGTVNNYQIAKKYINFYE